MIFSRVLQLDAGHDAIAALKKSPLQGQASKKQNKKIQIQRGGGGCLNTPNTIFFTQRGVFEHPKHPPRYAYDAYDVKTLIYN